MVLSIVCRNQNEKKMRQINTQTNDMMNTKYCNMKGIRRQTGAIAGEHLAFLDGAALGDIDIFAQSGENRRKVRRIIEKRVSQELYRGNRRASAADNYGRFNERRRVSNHIRNIYGGYPCSVEYVA